VFLTRRARAIPRVRRRTALARGGNGCLVYTRAVTLDKFEDPSVRGISVQNEQAELDGVASRSGGAGRRLYWYRRLRLGTQHIRYGRKNARVAAGTSALTNVLKRNVT